MAPFHLFHYSKHDQQYSTMDQPSLDFSKYFFFYCILYNESRPQLNFNFVFDIIGSIIQLEHTQMT